MSLENLHEPSSTLTSTSSTNTSSSTNGITIQSEATRLTSLKDNITNRLDIYFEVLKSNNATMSTDLIDPQGFPRADLDVASIRTARSQINRLRNDLKDVIKQMSNLLERGLPRTDQVEEEDVTMTNGNGTEVKAKSEVEDTPFARVDGVFPNSPADIAGLKREDKIVSLGSVNSINHDSLKAVAALVGASEGVTLPLVISRPTSTEEPQILHLRLTPKTGWGGRGLLGCHIVPI